MELGTFYKKKGYCKSLLDTPCKTKEEAVAIEQMLNDGATFKRLSLASLIETKKANEDPRDNGYKSALLKASTNDIDRDGESIVIKGIDLKHYRLNPIICVNHDYHEMPIGRSAWEDISSGSLISKALFAKKPEDWDTAWEPDRVFALAEQNIIKGVSIGFMELDKSAPTEKELRADPKLASCKAIIRKSRLLEISIVSIPCNQMAGILETEKGIDEVDFWDWSNEELVAVKEVAPVVDRRLELLRKLHNKLTIK